MGKFDPGTCSDDQLLETVAAVHHGADANQVCKDLMATVGFKNQMTTLEIVDGKIQKDSKGNPIKIMAPVYKHPGQIIGGLTEAIIKRAIADPALVAKAKTAYLYDIPAKSQRGRKAHNPLATAP